jgi:hypothetical protein
LEANLSPLFPWPTFPHKKINKKKKIPKPKNSFKRPQTPSPPWPKRKKERKREERGKGGERGKRRSQKNSKEKIGCKYYELKSFKLHLPP